MADTHLILHVKGTERETTELPKQQVRAAISKGQLTHSQLIWSPTDNAWKQVREMPHLLPSQQLAPAPMPRVGTTTLPKVESVPQKTGTVPRVAAAAPAGSGNPKPQVAVKVSAGAGGSKPQVAVKVATGAAKARAVATPSVRAKAQAGTSGNLVVKEAHEFHPVKWVCIVLGAVILLAVGINYLLVDRPLVSQLGETSYTGVPVYAHLGAFMQPNVLVIHIPASASITEANLTDFLVALAKSTPEAPFGHHSFLRVALTSHWTGRYSFSGENWRELGDMGKDEEAQRKDFLLGSLGDAAGNSLMPPSTLNDDEQQAGRERVWKHFVQEFTQTQN